MRTIRGPEMRTTNDPNELQFVVSLTKNLRNLVTMIGETGKQKMEEIGKSLAHQFDNDAALKESLQNDPRVEDGDRAMRQVDIRKDEDNSLLFKAFVSWNKQLKCWHIFLELPEETIWEDGETNL